MPCPLCHSPLAAPFEACEGRRYFHCPECDLAFLDPAQRLDAAAARTHYGHHQNCPEDPRYRSFLDRLVLPLQAKLKPGERGLDYGSGPGPTLSVMLGERGFPVANYDPLFAPDERALQGVYDFIACTETAEHFFDPAAEFERLSDLLRPGGWLGVMTEYRSPERPLAQWRYARDPTHVCFYTSRTMEWIARRRGWHLEEPAPGIALFHAPAKPSAFRSDPGLSIRRPRPADWPRMLEILETVNYHRIGGLEMADFPLADCFVAEREGVLVGLAGYRILDADRAKTTLMAVDPAFRGCGAGWLLQKTRMDFLRKRGLRTLTTNCDDEKVIDWYVRHFGYRPTGARVPKLEPFGRDDRAEWITLECAL